eukprot:Gb_20307 [translate_table: standard]
MVHLSVEVGPSTFHLHLGLPSLQLAQELLQALPGHHHYYHGFLSFSQCSQVVLGPHQYHHGVLSFLQHLCFLSLRQLLHLQPCLHL